MNAFSSPSQTPARRIVRIGIGDPVGSGKTMLVLRLCEWLRDEVSLGVITNDIYTREDAELLVRHAALPPIACSAWKPAAARTPPFAMTPA